MFSATYRDCTEPGGNHLEATDDQGNRLEIHRGTAGDGSGEYIYWKIYDRDGGYVSTARFTDIQFDKLSDIIATKDFDWEGTARA
jgi:hypothetical protein